VANFGSHAFFCSAVPLRVDDAGDRHPDRRNALDDLGVGRGRHAQAAILGGNGAAEEPHLLHLLDDLRRVDVLVLQLVHVRTHLAFEEAVDSVEDHAFVVGFGRDFRVHG
jgi:hypothetical protein